MHDGQICLPYGRGKIRLAHPWAPYNRGIYRRPGGTLSRLPGPRHDDSSLPSAASLRAAARRRSWSEIASRRRPDRPSGLTTSASRRSAECEGVSTATGDAIAAASRQTVAIPVRRSRRAPSVCHECIWWQSRSRTVDKHRWIQKAEEEWGAWGTVYHDADGRLLGSMQYGPAALFPRAAELPAGPPSSDAVLVTCAYVVDAHSPWAMQSLFLAAIGDARDRGREGPGGVRVPLPGRRVDLRAVPRPPHGLSLGLPRGLRVPHGAYAGACGAGAPRARRARARRGGPARAGRARPEGGGHPGARAAASVG